MAHDNLSNGLQSTKTRLIAERRVADSIRGSLSTILHENRGLDHVFGEFKGAWLRISPVQICWNQLRRFIHASGEETRPAAMPAVVNTASPEIVGKLPGLLYSSRGEAPVSSLYTPSILSLVQL